MGKGRAGQSRFQAARHTTEIGRAGQGKTLGIKQGEEQGRAGQGRAGQGSDLKACQLAFELQSPELDEGMLLGVGALPTGSVVICTWLLVQWRVHCIPALLSHSCLSNCTPQTGQGLIKDHPRTVPSCIMTLLNVKLCLLLNFYSSAKIVMLCHMAV